LRVFKARPRKLFLEVTTRCNIRCIQCARSSDPAFNRTARDLEWPVYERIRPIIPGLLQVNLFGFGEPFMHPRMLDMISDIKRSGVAINVTSNGVLVAGETATAVVEAGMDELTISMDGAKPETFDGIRRGAGFTRVVSNVRELNALKKAKGSMRPLVRFEFVAMRRNISELPELVDLASSLGVMEVIVVHLQEYGLTKGESVASETALTGPVFDEAARKARELGVLLRLPATSGQACAAPLAGDLVRDCLDPWLSPFISVDGEVRPCCISARSMGSLKEKDFWEIWRSREYEEFRAAMKSASPPEECRDCILRPWRKRRPLLDAVQTPLPLFVLSYLRSHGLKKTLGKISSILSDKLAARR
jgi:MoaA/NifB/PqqE/SkfB family radical SAM enzyme